MNFALRLRTPSNSDARPLAAENQSILTVSGGVPPPSIHS
jgi:hypothetical protein